MRFFSVRAPTLPCCFRCCIRRSSESRRKCVVLSNLCLFAFVVVVDVFFVCFILLFFVYCWLLFWRLIGGCFNVPATCEVCFWERICFDSLTCLLLLFLLLRSPVRSLGFPILGEIFAYVTFLFIYFLNPTIEVVTFRLHGWCMLDVFCCRHSPV